MNKQELLHQYLQNHLHNEYKQLLLYVENTQGKRHPKRDLFYTLKLSIDTFLQEKSPVRWIVIPGLRGVGKTTLLAQLFFTYREVLSNPILYLSLDEVKTKLNCSLYEVLDAWEEILGTQYSFLQKPLLLLLDEVSYDPQWQVALKSLFDRTRNVCVVATGSSAISLQLSADNARRCMNYSLFPLSFQEYLQMTKSDEATNRWMSVLSPFSDALQKTKQWKTDPALLYTVATKYKNEIQSIWQELDSYELLHYLQYFSLPCTIDYQNKTQIFSVLNQVVNRIIRMDIPSMEGYSREVIDRIPVLLYLIASSDTLSYQSLAENTGLSVKTIVSVLETLLQAELLIRFYPYSTSVGRKVRKSSKFLFAASSIRASLLHAIDSTSLQTKYKGKFLEDAVGLWLLQQCKHSFTTQCYVDPVKNGADFILQTPTKKMVVEVGWNKKGTQQIINTMDRIQGDCGILLTNTNLQYDTKNRILHLPLDIFFLLPHEILNG